MNDASGFLWRLAAVGLVMLAASGGALGQSYPAPEATPAIAGNYTVSYLPNCAGLPSGLSCAFTYLQEQAGPAGSWRNISSGSGSVAIQGQAAGSYSYRVYAGAVGPDHTTIVVYSAAITVVVAAAPARADIRTQMSYRYEVRQGDSNGDGRTDLFLRKSSGGSAYDGTLEQLLLQQLADRSFAAAVPSGATAAAARYWPASSVAPVVADVNVDGYVDVTLSGVAAAIAGASDQIVFASGQPGVAAPIALRSYDAGLAQFTGNMLDYFADQRYFMDNAPYRYVGYWDFYTYCDPWVDSTMDTLYWGYLAYLSACFVDAEYVYGVYQDYSVFSDAAIRFWINDQDARNGFMDENQALAEVERSVEGLLGTAIGGWPMEEILGQSGDHTDPFVRRAIEIGQSILGQARGGRNATTSDLVPPQEPRLPDHIYITGHPLAFARSRGHLALEYVDSLGGGIPYRGTTISAEPEHNNFFDFGKLLAKDDRPTDHPLMNFYLGRVEPLATSPYDYWTGYLQRRHDNYRSLPYSLLVDYAIIPSVEGGTSNSNGYIGGITYDDPARVALSVPFGIGSRYPGWNEPVPQIKFQ